MDEKEEMISQCKKYQELYRQQIEEAQRAMKEMMNDYYPWSNLN